VRRRSLEGHGFNRAVNNTAIPGFSLERRTLRRSIYNIRPSGSRHGFVA
jgi:hypothetical protein